jgi:hypothetical protein
MSGKISTVLTIRDSNVTLTLNPGDLLNKEVGSLLKFDDDCALAVNGNTKNTRTRRLLRLNIMGSNLFVQAGKTFIYRPNAAAEQRDVRSVRLQPIVRVPML